MTCAADTSRVFSGEGITLVDGEHVRNRNRDDSNNIPMYGYRSMGGSMGYSYFDESSVISNEGNNECRVHRE